MYWYQVSSVSCPVWRSKNPEVMISPTPITWGSLKHSEVSWMLYFAFLIVTTGRIYLTCSGYIAWRLFYFKIKKCLTYLLMNWKSGSVTCKPSIWFPYISLQIPLLGLWKTKNQMNPKYFLLTGSLIGQSGNLSVSQRCLR